MAKTQSLAQLISFQGKRVLISGAAAGIGKAITARFAEAGAELELVDVDGARLAEVQSELAASGVSAHTHVVDLSQKDAIDALWASLRGLEPEVLINNAGIYPFKDFLDVEASFYERVMDINLHSVYWMCQHMIRQRGKKGGVIVNVGSIEALLPFKHDLAHYSMSKAGVIALTRALAKEHGKDGFRVNVVVPGGIVTQGTRSIALDFRRWRWSLLKTGLEFKWRLPLGRFGQPDEIARMVLVLASDLSSYVHGAIVPVDGGFLAA